MKEESVDRGIGWLRKIIQLEKTHGFFNILKGLVLVLLAGYVIFFTINPTYLLEKIETRKSAKTEGAIARRIDTDAEVREILKKVLSVTESDRVWLIEMHNGSHNIASGLPFLFGSMRIEETRPGIPNVDEEYSDFSLSKYGFIAELLQRGYFYGSVEQVKEIDERMYYKLKSNEVNELALLVLSCGSKPLGVIGITFCRDNHMNPELTGSAIRNYGVQVATLLSK